MITIYTCSQVTWTNWPLRRRLVHARGDSFVAAPLLRCDPLGRGLEVSTKPQLCSLRGYQPEHQNFKSKRETSLSQKGLPFQMFRNNIYGKFSTEKDPQKSRAQSCFPTGYGSLRTTSRQKSSQSGFSCVNKRGLGLTSLSRDKLSLSLSLQFCD